MRSRTSFLALGTAATWAAVAWVLVEPLLRERDRRGDYLFGHYHQLDLYVGLPCLAAAVVTSLAWLVPRAAARTAAIVVAGFAALGLFDLAFTFLVCGIATPNRWLDQAHVSRLDNEPDPELGFRRKPDRHWTGRVAGVDRIVTYRADARGFRNPPGVGDRADVVFVGDSYTEAAQVELEDTFALRVGAATGLRVVNLGRGAYGPQQELIVLRRHGLAFAPRAVVWQLFDGNDLGDAEEFARWRDEEPEPAVPLLQRYLHNSFFRRFLDETVRTKRGEFAALELGDGRRVALSLRYRWQPRQVETRARGWQETADSLREGARLCRERGIGLCVLFVPTMARVCRDRLTFDGAAERERWLPDDPPEPLHFGAAVARLCAELGVDLIDMYPTFREAASARPDGIYIPTDEHLDRRGHELVAERVARWLPDRAR
jgi:hypothetical protein